MTTASDLREIAHNHVMINKILVYCREAADKGLFDIRFCEYISPAVQHHLENVHGFTVKENLINRFNLIYADYNYTISWR